MVSQSEAKLWIQELDNVIKTFPQCVISGLIIKYLENELEFDTVLTPTCTHDYDHKEFTINDFVKVEPTQITVTQYNKEWIYIPLKNKIQDKFKICLYISGTDCKFLFIKNSTQYQTFIGSTATVETCNCYISPIGKCFILIDHIEDKDQVSLIYFDNKTQKPTSKVSQSYKKGTFSLCDTLLVGIGFFPQSVTILPSPTEQEIDDAMSVASGGCMCEHCQKLPPLLIYNTICAICAAK